MNREASRPLWVIAFVVAGLVAVVGISRQVGGKDLIPWRQDLAKAREEGARVGKPVLVYFTAEWCGPCQSLKRTTWSDKRVEEALRGYVPVKIDIDRQAEVARRYGVESIPRFVVLDGEGRAVRGTVGAIDAEGFLGWLKG